MDDVDRLLSRFYERQAAAGGIVPGPQGGVVPGQVPGATPTPPPDADPVAQQLGAALAELVRRNLVQHIRLGRLSQAFAERVARVVELRREHQAELEARTEAAKAQHDQLLAVFNEYRLAHGDLPVRPVMANWHGDGFVTEYATLTFSQGGEGVTELAVLQPDGMWQREAKVAVPVDCGLPGPGDGFVAVCPQCGAQHDTRNCTGPEYCSCCAAIAREAYGAAAGDLPTPGATCAPQPGTAPGTNGEDTT